MYCEVVNHFLETYTTDDVMAETDVKIIRLTQPMDNNEMEYAE